jgi:hypothetical protein
VQVLLKKLKSFSPLNIIFFIPLIPHFNIIEDLLHTDDIPVFVFLILFLIRITSLFQSFKPIKGYLYIDFFILYLLIQNIYLGNGFFNTEILRFAFYALIFFFILGNKMESFYEYLPVYLFIFLAVFRSLPISFPLI